MPITAMEQMVRDILFDDHMRRGGKIGRLRELYDEARGLQRLDSESALDLDDGVEDDLRVIEEALHDLDADVYGRGAAIL